jgi:IclR family transcriptional regulator, KDG regulon repressor
MANALSRLVQAFDLLAEHPRGLSVTELAEKMRTSKSTSSRLLASLVEDGLVERDEAQRHFLDVRFWTWGVQAARRLAVLDIARPHIAVAVKQYQTPAYVAVVRGHQTIYLESITFSQEDAMFNLVSYVVPVYACAPGKAILAFSSRDSQEEVLKGPLKKFTPHTFATRAGLSGELERIRRQGYAVNRGEHYDNGRLAVAVPIRDQDGVPVAAVCFYGMTAEESLQTVISPLLQLGETVSASLGYSRAVRELVG